MPKHALNIVKHEPPHPCCGSCVHWSGGFEEIRAKGRVYNDKFHYCTQLVTLTRRERAGGREVGHLMPIEAVELLDGMAQWQHLRPRSHFVCEQWRSEANETLLDPERFPLDSQTYRLEREQLIDPATALRAAEMQRAAAERWVQSERPVKPPPAPKQSLLPLFDPAVDRAAYVLRATA